MLSLSTIRREGYFTELAQTDYYFLGGERPGVWLSLSGSAAKPEGEVTKTALENVLAGLTRNGSRRLVKAHPSRQKGWDLTFSAPKSVSVLYAIAPERVRNKILKAHHAAVEASLKYLVRQAVLARRGGAGKEFESVARVVAALFPHVSSRASDPALHTHALLANLAWRQDGTTGALWSKEVYKHKLAAGAVYRVELAHQLQQRLGVLVYRVRDWFEIVGIPKAIRQHFSKRSEEVRSIAREYGLSSPRFLELVTKVTQGVKGHLPHQELHTAWRRAASRFGLTQQTLKALLDWRRPTLSEKRAKRIAASAAFDAIDRLTRRRSYFTEKDLVQHAARGVMGRGGGADLLARSVEAAKRQLIKLDTPGLRYDHYTTPELYRTEKKTLEIAQGWGRTVGHRPVPFAKLLPILDREARYGTAADKRLHRLERLNLEAAVRHLVCSGEQVRFVIGQHRSGKTTALRLAKAALVASGKQVVCCAVTAAGAKELRREVGGDCVTVATLLDAVSPTYRRRAAHAAKQLWRAARNKQTHRRGEKKLEPEQRIAHYLRNLNRVLRGSLPTFAGKIELGKNTVVLLDQGEQLDTRTAHDLMKAIQKSGSAIRIALGDDSPTGAGPGGVMRHAADRIGAHRLRREQRSEKEDWRRVAHQALTDHNPEEFLRQYRKSKALTETPSARRAVTAIAKDWARDRAKAKDKLVIASDPEEVRRINRAVQKERAKRFGVSLGGVKVPSGDRIRTGDRVRFGKRSGWIGVDAGDFGTVLNVAVSRKNPLAKKITVRVDEKKRMGILPKVVTVHTRKYKDLTLGYAVLSHQAEAKAKSVCVLLNPDKSTRESTLHQVTRSSGKTQVYAVKPSIQRDTDQLLESLRQQQQKTTAHQLEEQQRRQRQAMARSA